MILFLKQVKTFIYKCFLKNVNTLSKKLSKYVDDNLEGSFGFSSEEENCNKETSDEKKLLIKKITELN